MIDTTVTYLGMRLKNPLVVGASPMVDQLDTVRQLEDAGVSAIVMHSLFEEQIERERHAAFECFDDTSYVSAESTSVMPNPDEFRLGPDAYLDQIQRIKHAVAVPVIASLNGATPGGWLEYAGLIQQAGADALELNIYEVVTDPEETCAEVEARLLELVRIVKHTVKIPVAVKLSPFFSALPNFAREIQRAGADGLVLFNRFLQPDIDPEQLTIARMALSNPSELLLRLRWLAVLSSQLRVSLSASGGVHSAVDVVKAVMAGADTVQMVSALLQRGPRYAAEVLAGLVQWMDEHGYDSLEMMRGSMNLVRCPDPRAYERANYMRLLQTWQG